MTDLHEFWSTLEEEPPRTYVPPPPPSGLPDECDLIGSVDFETKIGKPDYDVGKNIIPHDVEVQVRRGNIDYVLINLFPEEFERLQKNKRIKELNGFPTYFTSFGNIIYLWPVPDRVEYIIVRSSGTLARDRARREYENYWRKLQEMTRYP